MSQSPTDPQPAPRGRAYEGDGVTVFFDARRCVHFAECVRGLPDVFDTAARPWIQAHGAPAERVAEIVRRCPSGALQYAFENGPAEEAEGPTTITAVTDRALTIRGDLRLQLADGEVRETRAALCRCGLSENKPFCDLGCERAGWRSDD